MGQKPEKDMMTSIGALAKVLMTHGRDWVRDEDGYRWVYEASFNGVFSGGRLFPRGTDLGLQPLHVELHYPGEVRIHSCGVRDGCSRHQVRTGDFPLDDVAALERRISTHEIAATSISLRDMAWCLVTGDCSAITLHPPQERWPVSVPLVLPHLSRQSAPRRNHDVENSDRH